jgi:phenylacetate-coenzyme A ligase PaaK-like adenylate-forming protein
MGDLLNKTAPGVRIHYEERCRRTLQTALAEVSMYRRWRGLDPGPGRDIDERFRALPALTKDDIRAHFPTGLVPRGRDLDAAVARGEISFVHTSGTVDEAMENIWNQRWWDASERASWAINGIASRVATGSHREAILASALSVGPRSSGKPIGRTERTLGRFLFLNEYGSTDEWPEGHEQRILEELTDFAPAVLEANPSLLARLSRFAARNGAAAYQPALITLTYEFPSLLHLRAAREVFSSPMASSYGSTEAGYVFMECEAGMQHQNAEFCRVDVLPLGAGDCGGEPTPGAMGRLLVTTFGNEWFPLLRFEIGDAARIADKTCPCGRDFGITLSSIEGRLKSLCVAKDGGLISHGEIDGALAAVEGLEQYRLDQDSPRVARLAVVPRKGWGRRVVGAARDALNQLFGAGVDISVREVPGLSPEKSGKFLLASRNFPLNGLEARHG